MNSVAQTKSRHELAVMEAAIDEHNRLHGIALKIVDRPNPPDAILSDGHLTTWMEHTDAFFSREWARDLTTSAASVLHKPMDERGYFEPDAQLAENFCQCLLAKAGKRTYSDVIANYGPGILVVGLESPWLDQDSIAEINNRWAEIGATNISQTFRHIYLGFRTKSGNQAIAWP